MTTDPPPTITTSGHSYAINGLAVPSVTKILGDGYPKPNLVGWAAEETAKYALEHRDELAAMNPFDAMKQLGRARFIARDTATARGIAVHDLAEQIVGGADVRVPPDMIGFVDSAISFLTDLEVRPITTEQIVASTANHYAGRFDLCADTNRGRALIDYKTTTKTYGPFPESALQLAAYRWAEWWMEPDGTGAPAQQVEWCAVVQLRRDSFAVYPVEASYATFRSFLYVAEVAKIVGADRARFVGEPL